MNLGGRKVRGSRKTILAVAFLVLLASATIASVALGQGAPAQEEPQPPLLTPKLIEEANQSHGLEVQRPEVDTQAAQELPHDELDGEEALELATAVFGTAVEEPAGIFDEMPPARYIGTNAAVMSAESLAKLDQVPGSESQAPAPTGPALVESLIPLRTEDEEGKVEPVDLGLEHSEGELQEENPIVPTGIPTELGEGVELGEAGIGISFPGAAAASPATTVEGNAAFYPNVAEDTDLLVAPMPTGVETLTQIRTPEAPRTQVERLSLPTGAVLTTTEGGGAEATLEGRQILEVTPPKSVDAAGEPVPTDLSVEGDELTITVSPGQGAAYPILVDPNFRLDEYNWTWGGSGFNGWEGRSSSSGYQALEHAGSYPALDLTAGYAGAANPGTGAEWTYTVPRYYSDHSETGSYPTSWIEYVSLTGMMYLDDNGSYFPEIVAGILTPGGAAWISNWTYNGTQGEFAGWSGYAAFSGEKSSQSKMFVFSLSTQEYESRARLRETLAAGATIELRDEDTPHFISAQAPGGWWNTTEPTLTYQAEDTGLGVTSLQVEPEGQSSAVRTFSVGCSGTTAQPCPRVMKSGESGRPVVKLNAPAAPTGEDNFEVSVQDPLYGFESGGTDPTPHTSTVTVPLKVDHTSPEITLTGALTEQEKLGTTKAEYPLTVKVADGNAEEPQSGVVKAELKVDGKKVAMANETAWNPNCTTQNCSVSATWTLKASEYAVGAHEVEVAATDAAGNVSSTTLEVETGQGPPQTSFTSPHPTYESHEVPTISFKATREGAAVEGATFKCSLDGTGETPTQPCTSPFKLPGHLAPKQWHVLLVQAVDKSGKADPTPARWRFQTGDYPATTDPKEKLVFPEVGDKTASYYTLEAEWGVNSEGKAGQGVSGVSFEMELPGMTKNEKGEEVHKPFEPVPAACVIDGQGRQVSWPLPVHSNPGHSQPVYLKVRGCPVFEAAGYPEKEILFRAVFDGGEKVAGASSPNATEFVYSRNATRVSTDAFETVGPASVDLLTGAITLSRTDVSIPVPGYEANLEFTRVYRSTQDGQLPGYSKILGGAWQPSSPLESEYEGQAWSRIEEKEVPEKAAVYGHECWNAQEETVACPAEPFQCNPEFCEQWEEEEAQPREAWIELFDNEGASIPFEISGNGYVAPEYAKELKLTKEGENYVLAYPNGTHTIFAKSGSESAAYLPQYISYQATPGSMRLFYQPEGKTLRLLKEIAPSPVTCPDEGSISTEGCRTLVFNYKEATVGGQSVKLLESIAYYGPSGIRSEGALVAAYSYTEVTNSEGKPEMMLTGEADPRLANSTEAYAYGPAPHGAFLTAVAPPGQQAWNLAYEYGSGNAPSRLKTVTRGGATTTIAYGVPVQGSGAPYAMGPETIAGWGQTDLPVDATAIFPANHVPSQYPPHEYTGAAVHYLDPEGHQVNVAAPSPPGISGASIATMETDMKGNVIRELSPRQRLLALESSESILRSHELDTHSVYNANGTELLESWGPVQQVRLESGELVGARRHTTIRYDEGETARPVGTPPAYLPTKETVAAVVPGTGAEIEPKVTETHYEWKLRKPTETIVDPGGLAIRTVTVYNGRGQVIETRQPKGVGGGTAGDTQTMYYGYEGGQCGGPERYANLPCIVSPVKQPGGKEIPYKWYTSYNNLGEPTQVVELTKMDKEGHSENARATETTYDAAGRRLTTQIKGNGGVEIPKSETVYNPSSGLPEEQRFVCEGECSTSTPKYVASIGGTGSGNGQLNGPRGVAVDSKGDVWVVDRANSRIEEFSESGTFLLAFGKAGTGNGELTNPWGIAVDSSGNVWVADSGNCRIQEFNPEGKFLQKFGTKATGASQGTEFVRPDGIAIAPGGKLWVTDNGGPRIAEFRQTVSNESERFVRNVAGTLPAGAGPEGVAVDRRGDVWVTEEEPANEVREYDKEGNFIRSVGSSGTGSGQFRAPTGIAIAPSGNVVVSDTNDNREEEFGPEGNFLRSFGSGSGAESFSEPKGIAITAGGVVFVADKNRNQVKKWNLDAGFNDRSTTTTYDSLGRPVEYEDADGNRTTTTYDAFGRPATVTDAKGTDTFHYDEASGLLTSMEVSGVGTFTATYDADGNLIARGLPNGITEKTTYNAADEPVKLADTKTSSCGESCTWYEESLERSVEGRILMGTSSLVRNHYSYDKDGRLTEAQETPIGGQCTSRGYTFDADSNRLTKTTRTGIEGMCAKSGGNTQKYEYDEADRLMGSGITYDAWGRITNLPGEDAGGKELVTSYFSNDMVATQSQGEVTNSFQLDATGRQRQREQAGGVAGTEVFHYDGPGDSTSWTSLGSTWSRNISGIGGELAAVQESSGTTTFKLADLHGDVVASASSSPTATKLLGTYRFSEFGEPLSEESAGRAGWLGGKARRTELSSGVIQMGARSYIPQLGRFLTPDSIRGGSANAYDYANQDPINVFDLNGECPHAKPGHGNCPGPPSPTKKERRHTARRANQSGQIQLHFGTRAGAVRFREYLSTANAYRWLKNLNLKAEEIKAAQIYEIEKKAAKVAAEEVSTSGDDCKAGSATAGTVLNIIGIGAAPETGGSSLILNGLGIAVAWAGAYGC